MRSYFSPRHSIVAMRCTDNHKHTQYFRVVNAKFNRTVCTTNRNADKNQSFLCHRDGMNRNRHACGLVLLLPPVIRRSDLGCDPNYLFSFYIHHKLFKNHIICSTSSGQINDFVRRLDLKKNIFMYTLIDLLCPHLIDKYRK